MRKERDNAIEAMGSVCQDTKLVEWQRNDTTRRLEDELWTYEGPSQYNKDAASPRRRELGLVLHREAPERQILRIIGRSKLRVVQRPRGKRFRRIP